MCTQVLQFLLAVTLSLNIQRNRNSSQHFVHSVAFQNWGGIVYFVVYLDKKFAQAPTCMDSQDSIYPYVLRGD